MAELTAQMVKDRMARFIGWTPTSVWPTEIPALDLMNEVGELFFNIRTWNFLERAPVDIDLVASQSYIALPTTVGRVTAIVPKTYPQYSLEQTTLEQVIAARQVGNGAWVQYLGSVVHEDPSGSPTMPAVRMEIGPIPTTSVTGAFTMAYRARWVPLTSTSSIVAIPEWTRGFFIRACSLYLAGQEKERDGDLESVMARLMQSPLFTALENQDATFQEDIGLIENGAERSGRLMWPAGLPYGKTVTYLPGP